MLVAAEQAYRAVTSRDARFDGCFVLAVRTTGIYCRPSCPARTPKPGNAEFFPTTAAAQAAGYRACRRCLPDAVPGSPEWNLRADLAGRAMRLINDGVVERSGVSGLAARLGYSTRHLTRVLTAELGAGPLGLARAHRAHSARILIETTELSFTDIAFAAGFSSLRQFNDTVREVFGATPTLLRRQAPRAGRVRKSAGPVRRTRAAAVGDAVGGAGARAGAIGPVRTGLGAGPAGAVTAGTAVTAGASAGAAASTAAGLSAAVPANVASSTSTAAVGNGDVSGNAGVSSAAGVLNLRLPYRSPIDTDGLFAFLAARALSGVEDAGPGHYTRSLRLPHGTGIATLRPADNHVAAALQLTDLRDLGSAVSRLRRLLDLDADPVAVADVLGDDHALAPVVRTAPGVRVPGSVDGTEIVVRALVGQQVSVSAARTTLGRLVAALGEPLSHPDGTVTTLFPTAEAIAKALANGADNVLPGPKRRTETVRRVAEELAGGNLQVHPGRDEADLRRELERIPGIGPWTAGYVAMRVLGAPDVLLDGDLVLRKGAAALGLPADARTLRAHADRWSPWRSYAGMLLWRSGRSGAA
ncbi:DNA-3-methyladenine glycosylase 2 family protein [Saccharopolyspora erythraea]|uniref:DNA-3-methyladenine glycosylase 2 family protein n=1 Tax=Saccharopolyspora erythraea TaxID=1836 RepID=UPI001BEE938D|nr:DNA-3-methyladenine glycosylase 2 [Saccharopolyspora erythraea]QUH00216.1 DNA-3-methyladenine glycosylase 2 family protein [Saccharopolyspora erythraea]